MDGFIDLGVCEGFFVRRDPERAAILLPGAFYVPAAPLLWFTREVLEAADWSVLQVWDRRTDTSDPVAWVTARLDSALGAIASSTTQLVVAKSITSLAAPAVARRGLPAVWFTPLLNQAHVRNGLQAARAPQMVFGGTADPTWDTAFAASLGQSAVVEIEGADHSLQFPRDPEGSLRVLGTICDAVATFAGELG